MYTSIRYILLCALRDRLFAGLIAGVILATLISATLGSTAFLEEREMSLAYAGASSRLILVVGLIIFCCFHLRNAFDTREIDVMLSRPISRPKLALAYWLGFAVICILLVAPTTVVMALVGPLDRTGFVWWVLSLLLETWCVAAMALFAALALKSAVTSVMACLGFYVLSRMMAFFVMTADSFGRSELLVISARYALKAVSFVIPRLDFFGKTEWLIYGIASAQAFQLFLLQSALFIPLLLLAAVVDFKRKQF